MADADKIDDYELVNCVSTGSSTQVWEVKRPGATQSLAMKILLPEAFKDPEQKKSLKHEATVGKSLEHPNIVRIQELKMTKQHGYFVMEYFRGANLKGLIRNELPYTQSLAKKLMECLSQALGYMHDKNWLHKDVKPDNVLLTKGGEVRLIDFSLAGRPDSSIARALTKKSNIVIQGTRTYLAPEVIRRERVTHSADIYSLGVLFFELLTGNPPFRTANPNDLLMMHVRDKPAAPSEFNPNVSPEADALAARLLAKQPKDRPSNMHELFAEVRNLKLFKDDPVEVAKALREKVEKSDAQAENDRLNSRLDAQRTAEGIVRPAPKPKAKPQPPPQVEKPAAKAQAPAAAQAAPPQFGGYPGMPYPGMPYPGMPMPGMPMPGGYPMPPGMPMGHPGYPQMPGMPMPGFPGMPYPVPGAPTAPPAGQTPPPPGAPGTPPANPPVPTAPKPTASKPPARSEPAEDLPLASLDDLEIE